MAATTQKYLRQLYTTPPRFIVGKDGTGAERSKMVAAFNQATLQNVKDFAHKQKLEDQVDFTQGTVQTHLSVISFACTDMFAAALQKAKLPGTGKFMKQSGGFGLISPVTPGKP